MRDDAPPTPRPPPTMAQMNGEPDALDSARSPLNAYAPMPDAARGRVLVVDADRGVADAVRCVLGATHDVVACCDPRDAVLCVVRGHDFDVILFDVDVPYVSAQDFRDEIAAVHPALAERIVLLGAPASATRSVYLTKPLDAEAVKRTVTELVDLRTRPPRAPFRRMA